MTLLFALTLVAGIPFYALEMLLLELARLLCWISPYAISRHLSKELLLRVPMPDELRGMLERFIMLGAPYVDYKFIVMGEEVRASDAAARLSVSFHELKDAYESLAEAHNRAIDAIDKYQARFGFLDDETEEIPIPSVLKNKE